MKTLDEELQEIEELIDGIEGYDYSKTTKLIMDKIRKLVEDQFYLGYFADGFLKGWKAACDKHGHEMNDQIAITKHHQWVSEVKKQMESNISKQLT